MYLLINENLGEVQVVVNWGPLAPNGVAVSGTETEQDSVLGKLAIFAAGPSQVQQPLLVPYFLYVKKGFSLLGFSWVPKWKLK